VADRWAGQSLGWRYLARRTYGNGQAGPWLDNELPLKDVGITRVLSGPHQLSATIEPVHARLLMSDGLPLLTEYDTELYAEKDGIIRYGGHVVRNQYVGHSNEIEASGFSGYAKDIGYTGDATFTETDPLTIVRHIWQHIQSAPASNIGLVLDGMTTTPVRIGKQPPAATAESSTTTSEEPYRLAEWNTPDLGGKIDELAKNTPFSYLEEHGWNADKTDITHRLNFGYPTLGRRRNLTLVVGEHIQVVPSVERDGADYANHVRVLGAGEGSAMVRADAFVRDGRLRRMLTIADDSITDVNDAQTRARDELALRQQITQLSSLTIRATGDTALGAFDVGDEVRVLSDVGWLHIDQWVRIVSLAIAPEDPALATASVVRADRLAA
jgi:hypothetical protein